MKKLLIALVLGLLVSSAKGTFDTLSTGIKQSGAKLILLDRVLFGRDARRERNCRPLEVAYVNPGEAQRSRRSEVSA